MIEGSIAKRWARALIELAREGNQIEEVREQLNAFSALLDADGEVLSVLESPSFGNREKIAIVKQIAEGQNLLPVVRNFLSLAMEKDRARYLRPIISEYVRMADELTGIVKGELVVAEAMNDAAVEQVRAALEKSTGKKIQLNVKVDPAILGGAVVRLGSLVVDGSVCAQLETMSRELVGAE